MDSPGDSGTTRGAGTRERLTEAALRLFAHKGFRATTVGEIEAAAGLTPRAGAFYRHFRSKEEVLHAAVERYAGRLEGFGELAALLPLGDVRAELTLMVRWALRFLREQQPLLRILLRDADQFPELLARVHERLVGRGYERAEGLFGEMLRRARRPVEGARGIAAVALGAIVHYVEDEALYGVPPAGATEEEFERAWVDAWARVLGQDPATGPSRSSG